MSVSAALLVSGGGVGVCFFLPVVYIVLLCIVWSRYLLGFFPEFFSQLGFPLVIFPGDDGYIPLNYFFGPQLGCCKLLFNCVMNYQWPRAPQAETQSVVIVWLHA